MSIALKDKLNSLTEEKRSTLLNILSKKKKNFNSMVINSVKREEGINSYPVSSHQKSMWFESQLYPNSFRYNVPFAYRMKGNLDLDLMTKTLNKIIEKHEVFRTSFKDINGEVMQVVAPFLEYTLHVEDIQNISGDKEKYALYLSREHTKQIFEMDKLPLFKFSLIRVGEDDNIFVGVIHHILIDKWSLDIFRKEFSTIYDLYDKGREDEIEALPIQYVDFTLWQRNWFTEDNEKKQLDFWVDHLKGKTENFEFISDSNITDDTIYIGDNHYFEIRNSLSLDLKKIALKNNATLYMVLFAAYNALLYKYTSSDRIVLASPFSNRKANNLENMIGCFINSFVFSIQTGDNPTYLELLDRIKKITLGAYQNQDISISKVVKEIQPGSLLNKNTFFKMMFNFSNSPTHELNIGSIKLEEFGMGGLSATSDISFHLWESEGRICCNFEYKSELFNRSTIVRLGEHFKLILDHIVQAPNNSLSQFDILLPKEKKTILMTWNNNYIDENSFEPISVLFEKQVLLTPKEVALHFEGETLTYQELNEKANQMANYLIQHKRFKKGEKVGILMDRSLEVVFALLGVIKAGGIYVPLDPIYPEERIKTILKSSKASFVITQKEILQDISKMIDYKVICVDRMKRELELQNKKNIKTIIKPYDIMYILFTSGSTGEPKGVKVQHRNYYNYLQGIIKEYKIDEPMDFAIVTSFAADLGTTNVFVPLTTGGSVHIVTYERSTDPEKFKEYFSHNNIDAMKLVPSHFDVLQSVNDPKVIIPKKLLILAGEACKAKIINDVRKLQSKCRIYNNYGPTETTVSVLSYKVPDDYCENDEAIVPLGRPINNTSTYILDEYGHNVPIGVGGELYIGGNSVSGGYLDLPEDTQEKFIPNPFDKNDKNMLYRTGDRVKYLEDGNIQFIGRVDRQIKIRGYRVELSCIEDVITSFETIKESIVSVQKDEEGHEKLVAYITVNMAFDSVDHVLLRNFIRSKLPDYMIPTFFKELEVIPLNSNGKIDYYSLPAIDTSFVMNSDSYMAPRNEFEKRIAEIWQVVLGIKKIGIDDHFFDLGGDSFKAIKIAKKISKTFSVIEIFKKPTIRELGRSMESDIHSKDGGVLLELTSTEGQYNELNYICLPFGGANAIAYHTLASELPINYGLYSVQLPGHDISNVDEPLMSFEEIAEKCVDEAKKKIKGPIAVFGQCVGGAIGLKVAYKLEEEGFDIVGVFQSANFPNTRMPGKWFSFMEKIFPRDKLISNRVYREILRSLGNDDEYDKEEETFILKALRHDSRSSEEYFVELFGTDKIKKLNAPIHCIIGSQDRTTEFYQERYMEWSAFSDRVTLNVVDGAGHFLHKHQAEEVCDIMNNRCCELLQNKEISYENDLTKIIEIPSSKKAAVFSKLNIFTLVILGQFVSLVGSSLAGFALGVWVLEQTGDITLFGIISVGALLPGILLSPIAGTFADRWDKRKLMIFGDVLAATGTTLVFFMLIFNRLEMWHIIVAAVLSSTGGAFQRPAFLSALPQIVPKRYLGQANGMVSIAMSTGEVVAPILGGMLIFLIGLKGVILIDISTFLFSMTILLFVKFPKMMFKKMEETFMKELVGGWNYIIKRKSLRAMVLFFILANFLMSLITVLFIPLIMSYDISNIQVGWIISSNAVGVLLGSFFMSVWGGTARRTKGMIGSLIITGVAMIIMGAKSSPIYTAIGLFLFGFSIAFVNTHWQIIIQTKVGLELQGRVFSINMMIAFIMRPVAFLLAGPLTEKIFEPFMVQHNDLALNLGYLIGFGTGRGMGLLFILAGIIMIIWTILGLKYRPLYYMEDILPDAIPDAIILKDKDELQRMYDQQL